MLILQLKAKAKLKNKIRILQFQHVDPAALSMTFNADKRLEINFGGETISDLKWYLLDDWGSIDSDQDVGFSWTLGEDSLEVVYSKDGNYWVFTCTKG